MPLTKSCSPWYDRIARCNNVIPEKIPELEAYLSSRLEDFRNGYLANLETFCEGFRSVQKQFPGILLVSGEGVTYCSHQDVLWEEKSEEFWEILKITILKYKEIGLWGTLIKTCCGPEDPSWRMCKDKIRELNALFLSND